MTGEDTRPSADAEASPFRAFLTAARNASDKVKTASFAAISTGSFLAVTAAFGGLDAVAAEPAPEPAELTIGETHVGTQLAVTVQRAVLVDELRGAGAYPDDGERLIVVLVDVENLWTEPLDTGNVMHQVARSIRLDGIDTDAEGLVREDDQTMHPWLQPDVPALLAFSWTVPTDAYSDGEDLRIVLSDAPLHTFTFLRSGTSWTTPELAAFVTAPLEDLGAGTAEAGG